MSYHIVMIIILMISMVDRPPFLFKMLRVASLKTYLQGPASAPMRPPGPWPLPLPPPPSRLESWEGPAKATTECQGLLSGGWGMGSGGRGVGVRAWVCAQDLGSSSF